MHVVATGPVWQLSPYSMILGLSAVLAVAVAAVVRRRPATPGVTIFALLLIATAEWAALAASEHAAVAPALKLLCAKLEYPGILSVSPLWLTFALTYTERHRWLARRRLALLWIVPLVTLGLVWTNDWHRLIWTSTLPSSDLPGAPLVYRHGAWFWLAAGYNYVLNLAGALTLVGALVRFRDRYRAQTGALVAGLLMPWIGNALYLSGRSPLGGVDPTPLAFTLTGVIYAWGVFRLGLLDLVPVARHVLIETMTDGVLVVDAANRVIDINPSARALLGGPEAAALGEDIERVLAGWPALLDRCRDASREHAEVRMETGEEPRYFDVRVNPLRDWSGRQRGRLIVFGDITERKLAEETLRQNENLASLGRLLAGVAHELNNPLAVIVGHAAILRRHVGPGATASRVEKIEAAAERCARIVANFLTLARQRPPQRSRIDLNRILRDVVDLQAYQLGQDGIAIALDLADDLPLLWADGDQIYQVAVNLVVNAQQAMRTAPEPRRLTLASRHEAGRRRVAFSVTDTGPGMSAELRQRIFEPFFTTKAAGMGSGLGLALCRGIVEAHRGTIEVRSRPGAGAAFVVELPVSNEHDGPATEAAPAAQEIVRGKHILVVEDESAVAEILAEMLAADEHQVDIAPDGSVALEKIAARHFDLVMTDVKMPVLDGPGLYRSLALHDAGLRRRLVFVTGDTVSAETRQFIEMTGAPRLTKPFDVDAVRRAVRAALAAPDDAR